MTATASSGVYSFRPLAEEKVEVSTETERKERDLSRLQHELDALFHASSAKIDTVTAKALQLRQQIRRRPQSVSEMRAVLRSTPPPMPSIPESDEDA
jgi:cell division protein FtsL